MEEIELIRDAIVFGSIIISLSIASISIKMKSNTEEEDWYGK